MNYLTLKSIVTDFNNADCFTFVADESTDVIIKEQTARCVRYVHKKSDAGNRMKHSVREEFLSFVHAEIGTKADDMATKILEVIDSMGILRQQKRGQGYDGASVMSGHVSGVQTRTPTSQYVNCRPHVLNLCIVQSSKVRIVRNIKNTMTEVSVPFKTCH